MNEAIEQIVQAITNLDKRIRALSVSEDKLRAWVAPTLLNSWANSGGAYQVAGYWKDPWNIVHLRGRVTGGAFSSTIFTLPARFLPAATGSFSVPTGAVVDVQASGNVVAISGTTYVSLDSITFRAEA